MFSAVSPTPSTSVSGQAEQPVQYTPLSLSVSVCPSVTVFHGTEEEAHELERQLAADQDSVELESL